MVKKIFIKFLVILTLISIFSCKNKVKINDNYDIDNNIELFDKDNVKIYNLLNLKDVEIIVPKNQNDLQSYSIIFKNKNNELIIFDGGRIEDSKYLVSIIKSYGGVVSAWFLSHIHDDHIGALYQIISDKNTNIHIKNLYYNFASIDWYYEKIGNDAGALYLFENALNDYVNFLKTKNNNINVYKNIKMNDKYIFEDVAVEVINNLLKIDSDPINNSTIVYKVYFENNTLLSLGDLGYYGGEELIKIVNKDKLKSDIVVVSHHGQNGVSQEFYKLVSPKYSIWPTTKKIYENVDKKYNTEDTINVLKQIGTKNFYKTYEGTFIIR